MRNWNPEECIAVFPGSEDKKDLESLYAIMPRILQNNVKATTFIGHPVPVNASLEHRVMESLARRSQLCIYDEEMQSQDVIHIKHDYSQKWRLLTHFYAFVRFEDWKEDLWLKRLMRDHMRYSDEIMCAAARIVNALRLRSKEKNPEGNPEGLFNTLHVRRNDFSTQYPQSVVNEEELFRQTKNEFTPGSTIYIATDERNQTYFKPLADVYDVVFLTDFIHLLKDVNINYYGIVEQVVVAKGRTFFGVFYSTFSAYVTRLRGYYSVKGKLPGYDSGELPSTYYYAPKDFKTIAHSYAPITRPFFAREFPSAWLNIDQGIEELHRNTN